MHRLFEKLKRLRIILWIVLSTGVLSDGFTINKTAAVNDSITENRRSDTPQRIDNVIAKPHAFNESILNNKNELTTETNAYTDSVMDDGNDTGDLDSLFEDWKFRSERVEAIQFIPKRGEKLSSPYETGHTTTNKNAETSSVSFTESIPENVTSATKNESFDENSSSATTTENFIGKTSFFTNKSIIEKNEIDTFTKDPMITEETLTPNELTTIQEKTTVQKQSTVDSFITTTNSLQPQESNEINTKTSDDKDINYSNIVLTSKLPSGKLPGKKEESSFSSRHLHKNKNIYTISPNIKRYKKIDIKPPKPIWRDPDDNSWRNESISSLGITVKLNESPKPFSFKNKTVNLNFDTEIFTESYNDSSLRERLERLSLQRKTVKTTPKSYGNSFYYSKNNYDKTTEDSTSTKQSYDRYYKEFIDPEFESEIAALSEYYGKKIFAPEYASSKAEDNRKVSKKSFPSSTVPNYNRSPTEYSNEYNPPTASVKKSDLGSFIHEESTNNYKNQQYTIASSYYLHSPSISVSNKIYHPENKKTFQKPVPLEKNTDNRDEYSGSVDWNNKNEDFINAKDDLFSSSEFNRNQQFDTQKRAKNLANLDKTIDPLSGVFVASIPTTVDYHNEHLKNINVNNFGAAIVHSEIVHNNHGAAFPPSSDDEYLQSPMKSTMDIESKYAMRQEHEHKNIREEDLFQKIFDDFVSSKGKATTRLKTRQPVNREITQLYP